MVKVTDIKTGVIGIGLMGTYHSRIYKKCSKLVGISDINKELGQNLSSELSVPFFQNHLEMLDVVDAISIAVPTNFHYDIAVDAIDRGVSVLIEKPLASNPLLSKKLIDYAKNKNVVLAVGHIERFNAVITHFKERSLGKNEKIKSIFATRFSSYPSRIQDVGVVYDLTIHDIDLICDLFNSSPEAVQASSFITKNNIEEQVSVLMHFKDGLFAICETTWHSPKKIRKVEVLTDKNFWILDLLNGQIIQTKDTSEDVITEVQSCNSLEIEICDFLDAVKEQKSPLVSGREGYRAVKIAEAILSSIREKNS